jgi:hypothetical protein
MTIQFREGDLVHLHSRENPVHHLAEFSLPGLADQVIESREFSVQLPK